MKGIPGKGGVLRRIRIAFGPDAGGRGRMPAHGTTDQKVWGGFESLRARQRIRRSRATFSGARGGLLAYPGHRADGLGHIQPPGQCKRRQQRMAHPAPGAPQPGHEDLPVPAPGHDAGIPARTPAARHMTGSPGAGNPRSRPAAASHRPQAGTAIRWPRATPPRIPSRGRRNTGVPPTPRMCRQWLRRPAPRRPAAPGRRHVAFVAEQPREAPFRNKRRSANVGDAEGDA